MTEDPSSQVKTYDNKMMGNCSMSTHAKHAKMVSEVFGLND